MKQEKYRRGQQRVFRCSHPHLRINEEMAINRNSESQAEVWKTKKHSGPFVALHRNLDRTLVWTSKDCWQPLEMKKTSPTSSPQNSDVCKKDIWSTAKHLGDFDREEWILKAAQLYQNKRVAPINKQWAQIKSLKQNWNSWLAALTVKAFFPFWYLVKCRIKVI